MAKRQSKRRQRKQRRSRRYGGADEVPAPAAAAPANAQAPAAAAQAPVKEEKSFIDNIFGSEENKAPAPEEPKTDEAPAPEEKPGALASLFGTDKKEEEAAAAAPAPEPSAQPMKKKRSRRCKCYTPKKLRAACKRMRSRRRRSSQRHSSARMRQPMFEEAPRTNTFTNMYGAPPQREQMGF